MTRGIIYLGVAVLCASSLDAASVEFAAAGSNALAVFTQTGANSFTITLENTGVTLSAADLLTGFEFTLAGTSVSYQSSLDAGIQFVRVGASGDQTATDPAGGLGWGFGKVKGTAYTYLLCTICGSGVTDTAAQASQGMIGTTNASTNSSVAGNKAHNPYLVSGATFSFTTSGQQFSLTDISSATFLFGTAYGKSETTGQLVTTTAATPEPASILLISGGLLGAVLLRRRQQTNREPSAERRSADR
jgi:hypothetical protein